MAETFDISLLERELGIHDRIKYDRDENLLDGSFSWAEIRTFRDYANGKQTQVLTEGQKQILRGVLGRKFCDNVCKQIILSCIGRITFKGWTCSDETTKEWLDKLFLSLDVKHRQGDVHRRTVRDGNYAIHVNIDPNDKTRIEMFREPWWDGVSGVYIHYGENDKPQYAVKEWQVLINGTTVYRRVIWFEDRVERYYSLNNNTQWQEYKLSSDSEWPEKWLDENNKPLGIPYIHFYNGVNTYGPYGVSELDGGIIGFQDLINDQHYQIALTSRLTGGQQYWATGVKLPKKDGSSEPIPPKVDAGMFHTSPNSDAKFGVLPAGDVSKIIAALESDLKRVAQMTATPIHQITGGDWPAAEAIIRIEQPSVQKANLQIEAIGASWIKLAVLAARIHNAYNKQNKINLDKVEAPVGAEFADPEKRDVVTMSIVVHNLAEHCSTKQAWILLGKTEAQATDIAKERQEEKDAESEREMDRLVSRSLSGRSPAGKEASGGTADKSPNNQKQ